MSTGTEIIDVTFIDAETGATFLQLKLPARQLPESFATPTNLNLGKDDWQVVEASPVTAAEFIASGKLTLRMKKLVMMDPRDILFSLPTVADEVPKAVPGSGATLTLHEDDWMQLELIPAELRERIAPELDAIRDVLTNARKGAGFERLHIRKALPQPFAARTLELHEPASGIAWRGQDGVLEDGFVIGALYGTKTGARVTQLGITQRDADPVALRKRERLLLVDWLRAEVIE